MTEKVGLVKSWSFLDKGELSAATTEQKSDWQIILGYLGDEINSHEEVDPYATKIGGFPNWLGKSGDANLTPLCELCGKEAVLVTQAYSPLEVEAPDQHRVLYVFVCANPSHKNNWWHVVRSQVPVPPEELVQPEQAKTEETTENVFQSDDNWGADNDNWGTESEWNEEDETSNEDLARMIEQRAQEIQTLNANHKDTKQSKQQHTTQKENMTKDTTQQQANGTVSTKPHFIPYYLDVDEEPDASVEKKLTKKEAEMLKQYEMLENVDLQAESNDTWTNEEYESVTLASADKIFLKFQRRLARSPEQCLRYSFGGEPLWMTDQLPKDNSIPDCPYCGSERIFEMQLLPTLLSLKGLEWRHKPTQTEPTHEPNTENGTEKTPLQLLQEGTREARVDFGVVAIYSCSQSCAIDGMPYKKEWVFVQDSI